MQFIQDWIMKESSELGNLAGLDLEEISAW